MEAKVKNEIKQLREQQGLSQTDLGIKSSVPPAKICQIEKGVRCNQDTAIRVSKALGKAPNLVFPDFESLRSW
jgi:DNA-binding XRE family transcriptional regulator